MVEERIRGKCEQGRASIVRRYGPLEARETTWPPGFPEPGWFEIRDKRDEVHEK